MKQLLLLLMLTLSMFAGENDVYIIFDGSGSMWQTLPDGEHKVAAAQSVLKNFVKSNFAGQDLALRAYGHNRKADCSDTELVIPWSKPETFRKEVQSFLSTINPTGKTPITRSLKAALKDFGDRQGSIILISDGIETCDEDPCGLLALWRKKNIKIAVHVVGLGLDEKSKDAMKCLANAAGTEYRDANSAEELAAGLQDIHTETSSTRLRIVGWDAAGERLWPEGTLQQNGEIKYEVSSRHRSAVEAGIYQLTIGVRTKNGTIYKAVTQNIEVGKKGETLIEVTVPRPPSVKTKFIDRGENVRGSLVYAWKEGQEVFRFRWKDEVFLDEGSYEFRTSPNSANTLTVSESFNAGESKEIVFGMSKTVKVSIRFETAETKIHLRENAELWQDGVKKYRVHIFNPETIRPGVYDVILPHKLCPYTVRGVVFDDRPVQQHTFSVPVGYVTFHYQDSSGNRVKDKRCFVRNTIDKRRHYQESGKIQPLIPGTYTVSGWQGNYDPVEFSIQAGEEKVIILKDKN
ncbi:MAG: vWA domain-containing protein [Calditrichia bacterium]